MTTYKHRECERQLLDAVENIPVVVLSAMRQSGKSTMLMNMPELSGYRYITFDNLNTLEAARRDPEALVIGEKKLIIDEAQKVPEILSVIKEQVDKERHPGRFILSGSANFMLLKNVSESLAGRAVYLTLYPFNLREIRGDIKSVPAIMQFIKSKQFPTKRNIIKIGAEEIIRGGMPTICLRQVKKPEIWFRGYEQTYLERDIRSLSQVADLISFRHLMQLVALRNSRILNISELARDAKLNVVTTSRYLSLIETSFIMSRLYPYLGNRTSRLVKSPKIFMSDSGLAAFLAGVRELGIEEPQSGALLENYVAQNLISILAAHSPESRLNYWNVQGRHEVDFVIESGGETLPIEIKNGGRWRENDLSGIKAFMAATKKCRSGILAYNGKEIFTLKDNIWIVPISLLIS